MDSLIPIVNELQDILNTIKEGSGSNKEGSISIDLPEIAVVGSQSVGKSTLLDNIIGRHILPRGNGIVTRRPLILQLQQLIFDKEDYAEFGHKKGLKFTDFEKVREEIQVETNRLIGDNKKVSESPILLRIYSKKTINLTLVDLPGLTKVPVEDQPSDIDLQIKRIVLSYIKRPSCLILAITAANTDIANSDSLKIAREVDPEGKRTIGVLSKLDTVDNYTSTIQILNNRLYPLLKGHIAVMCRDLKKKNSGIKSLGPSLNDEKSFFENNINLRQVLYRCGTYNLIKILQTELIDQIICLMPRIKSQAKSLIELKKEELASYGDYSSFTFNNYEEVNTVTGELNFDNYNDVMNKGAIILNCFSKFSRKFQDMIEGKESYQSGIMILSGGARINYVFHNWFGNTLFKFDPLDGLTDDEIRMAIKNSTGTRSSLFVSEGAFEILSRIQIKKLLKPSLTCVEQVYIELKTLLYQCSLPELIRYSNLKKEIINVTHCVLQECLNPTKKAVIDLINIELSYINTNHPDFIGGASALTSIFDSDATPRNSGTFRLFDHKSSNNDNSVFDVRDDEKTNRIQPISTRKGNNNNVLNDFFKTQSDRTTTKLINSTSNSPTNNDYLSVNQGIANVMEYTNTTATNFDNQFTPNRENNSFENNPNCGITEQQQGGGVYLQNNNLFDSITKSFKSVNMFGVNESSNMKLNSEGKSLVNQLNIALQASNGSKYEDKSSLKGNHINININKEANLLLPNIPDIIKNSGGPTERERVESDVIKFFIVSYFNIVRKNIADSVPKIIMYFMVNAVKDRIQRELVTKLYKEDIFEELLLEDKEMIEKRKTCYKYIEKIENITCQLENLISNFKQCNANT